MRLDIYVHFRKKKRKPKAEDSRGRAVTIEFEERREIEMLTMTDTQQAEVTLKVKDKSGRPASVEGVPLWEVAPAGSEMVASVKPSASGMSATIIGRLPGDCQIRVTADADMGEGVSPIIGILDVAISGGPATIVELVASAPTEQSDPLPEAGLGHGFERSQLRQPGQPPVNELHTGEANKPPLQPSGAAQQNKDPKKA